MGFAAVEASRQTIHESMEQTGLQPPERAYGQSSQTPQPYIKTVIIPLSLTAAGGAVDVRKMSIRHFDSGTVEELTPNEPLMHASPISGCWSVIEIFNGNDNYLLEPGEIFRIGIAASRINNMRPYGKFTFEIKPAEGPELRIPLEVPAHIDRLTALIL